MYRLKSALLSSIILLFAQNIHAQSLVVKGTDPSVYNSTGSVGGMAGTYSLANTSLVACPPESFVGGIEGIETGPGILGALISQLRYDCRDAFGKQIAFRATDPSVQNSEGARHTTSLGDAVTVTCPAGSFATGLQAFKPNGSPPVVQIRYICKTPIGGTTGIKGTSPIVTGNEGSVAGLAGTYSLDNSNIVECPLYTFVSGIQAFKPNGGFPIYQIRYSCAGLQTAVGTIKPKYLVLLVAYAPPGTNGGKSISSVSYSSGSSAGTSTTVSQTFKSGMSSSVDASFLGIGGGNSFEATTSKTDSTSVDIKKSTNLTIKIDGPSANGIDHNRDYIYLWLQPQITLSLTSISAVWSFSGQGTALIQYVQAGWLSDSCLQNQNQPGCMPSSVYQTLTNLGLNNDDFKEIRTHDVLLNNGSLDPARFTPLTTSFTYEPPTSPSDPVPTTQVILTNESTTTTGQKVSDDYKVTTSISGDENFLNLVKVNMKSSNTLEWTNESSTSQTTGNSQTASATIGGPSSDYPVGPTMIQVYYDQVYKTFAFAPIAIPPNAIHGTVVSQDNKPVGNAPIFVSANGTLYHTFADSQGKWSLPYQISGECAVQAGTDPGQVIPNCATAGNVELKQQ